MYAPQFQSDSGYGPIACHRQTVPKGRENFEKSEKSRGLRPYPRRRSGRSPEADPRNRYGRHGQTVRQIGRARVASIDALSQETNAAKQYQRSKKISKRLGKSTITTKPSYCWAGDGGMRMDLEGAVGPRPIYGRIVL